LKFWHKVDADQRQHSSLRPHWYTLSYKNLFWEYEIGIWKQGHAIAIVGIHVSNSRNSVVYGESHRIYCKSTNRPHGQSTAPASEILVSEPFGLRPGRKELQYTLYRGHNRFKFIGAGTQMNSLQRARSHPHRSKL
jgi:hypothetical protein